MTPKTKKTLLDRVLGEAGTASVRARPRALWSTREGEGGEDDAGDSEDEDSEESGDQKKRRVKRSADQVKGEDPEPAFVIAKIKASPEFKSSARIFCRS